MQRRVGLVIGAAVLAVLLLAWVASAERPTLWREIQIESGDPGTVPPQTLPGTAPVTTVPPPEPGEPVDLDWLINTVLVLVAVGLVIAIVWWLSRRDWSRPVRRRAHPFVPMPEIAPEELLEAADEFDVLIARGSARNAIVACWVRLEGAVEQAGMVRNPAETPTEMTARVLRAYAVDAGSIGRLAALYREARFSTHEMGEAHREQAQAALADIRSQLQVAVDRAAAERAAAEAARTGARP